MTRLKIAGCIVLVALLAAAYIQALVSAFEPARVPRPHLLFIEAGAGERDQRALAGARAASQSVGVELEVATPDSVDAAGRQAAIVQRFSSAKYAGVAFCPADPESQIEIVNDLARKTKLVTLGNDCDNSRRMSHIGFSQFNAGRLGARVVRDELRRQGKVALLTTKLADARANIPVGERLDGFKQEWDHPDDASMIEVVIDPDNSERSSRDLQATLSDPSLAFIVALDANAAESAVKTLATLSNTSQVPILAFDPSRTIFDAIDRGQVAFAIYDDPYINGFTAIQRLAEYCHADADGIPAPGRGLEYIKSEVVRKENIANVRNRAGHIHVAEYRPKTRLPLAAANAF